jgi:hypothetical protein
MITQKESFWGGDEDAMSKPLLEKSAKAKAYFKALVQHVSSFTLNVTSLVYTPYKQRGITRIDFGSDLV